MKKKLLLLLFLAGVLNASSQVCIPEWIGTGSGISPDTTTNLPVGYVNQPYDVTFQFKVPKKAPFGTDSIDIDRIELTGVTGLNSIPSSVSFFYNCNPGDCSFKADSVGCVRLQGTATQAGVYALVIEANVYISPSFFIPFPTPGYDITIYQNVGITEVEETGFQVSEIFPNPSNDLAQLEVTLFEESELTVEIFNLLGQQVSEMSMQGSKEVYLISLPVSALPPGAYCCLVRNGVNSVMRPIIVSR